jgi:PmbA protein
MSGGSTTGRDASPSASGGELLALAQRCVGDARPGEQLEVVVSRSTSTNVRAYQGDVESFTSATTFAVGIRVIVEGRQGFAHAGTFDEAVLAETLADARDNATFAEPDPWAGLATPDGVAAVEQDLWNPAVPATTAERKVALALGLERAVLGRDPRIKGVRVCSYGDSASEFALASTAGIASAGRSTSCWTSVSALAEDAGETQVGYGVDVGRDPERLDVAKVAGDAVTEATRLLGARQAPSQRLALLLEAEQAAIVLGLVAGTLTGDTVLKQRSPFADRLGQVVASPLLTLVDDPTNPASLGADTYDGEGLACRRNVLVERGVLRGFLQNSYTGRRSGTASTGSAVRAARGLPSVGVQAMAVQPGRGSWDELVAGIDRGLMVQSMHGLHSGVNTTSGDFSVGVEGLMIRGGELAEPVREVTIASTLQRLLQDISAVGAELEWLPSGAGCSPLVIGEVSLSGS